MPSARVAVWLSGLLLAIAMGRPLGAQRQSALDVGFSVVEFPDDDAVVAGPSVGWSGRADSKRLFALANVGGVGTIDATTGFASLEGGARWSLGPGWITEVSGELYGAAGSASARSVAAMGSARLLRAVGPGGIWADVTAALAHRESGELPARGASLGLWRTLSNGRLSASLTRQAATAQLFTGPFRDQLVGTIPVAFTEGNLNLHLESDRASLDLAAGARRDAGAARLVEPTFAATAAFWQSPTRAWIVSYSRQLPDFVRGGDATRWLAVGMRFNEPTPLAARALRTRPVVLVAGEGEERMVRVRAPDARRVEVMGDFTDWAPVELVRTGATFERAMRLTPGTHRLVLRIDGGAWRVAANTPAVNDDLGGRAGLLVVP